jgi:glycogen debranching enzyme
MKNLSANFTAGQLVALSAMFDTFPDNVEAIAQFYLANMAKVVALAMKDRIESGEPLSDEWMGVLLSSMLADSAKQKPVAMSEGQVELLKTMDIDNL